MAAPADTKWGSIVNGSSSGRKGRLGIYTKVTNTNAETTVNVQVWFWTIYSCSDGGNNLYYDVGTGVTSATTKIGSVDIKHTVATGAQWNTANQTKLLDKTYTYARGESAKTYNVYAKFSSIDMLNAAVYVNTSYQVPALPSYTITYNANGGSGAPSSQTKWYGKTLTLSGTKPTKTGYSFNKWNTASGGGGTYYSAGGSYTANAGATLYAQWTANTYPVTYDANGGTGAPSAQTKTYGTTLTLSTTKPTKTNYNFLGWSTSKNGTVVYASGASYTANIAVTLYAVWELAYIKPRISNLSVYRCDSSGVASDDGTSVRVKFNYTCDQGIKYTYIEWVSTTGSGDKLENIHSSSAQSGTVDRIINSYTFTTESTYTITIHVEDTTDSSFATATVPGTVFSVDLLPGGGIAFGKPAERQGYAEFGFNAVFNGSVEGNVFGLGVLPQIGENEDFNNYLTPGAYGIGAHATAGTVKNNPAGAQAGRLIVCAATGGNVGVQYWSYIQQWYIPMSFEASGQKAIYVRTITRSPNSAPNYYAWLKFTATAV